MRVGESGPGQRPGVPEDRRLLQPQEAALDHRLSDIRANTREVWSTSGLRGIDQTCRGSRGHFTIDQDLYDSPIYKLAAKIYTPTSYGPTYSYVWVLKE